MFSGGRFIFAQMNNSEDRISVRLVYRVKTLTPGLKFLGHQRCLCCFLYISEMWLGFSASLWTQSWKKEVECMNQQKRHIIYFRCYLFSKKICSPQLLLWVGLITPTLSLSFFFGGEMVGVGMWLTQSFTAEFFINFFHLYRWHWFIFKNLCLYTAYVVSHFILFSSLSFKRKLHPK